LHHEDSQKQDGLMRYHNAKKATGGKYISNAVAENVKDGAIGEYG